MRGEIFCHVGQAEVVNVADVCSPSTNQVGHHENATTEDIPQVPGLKPLQRQPDEEKLAAWPQRNTLKHREQWVQDHRKTHVPKRTVIQKWESVQLLKTRAEGQTSSHDPSAERSNCNKKKKVRATYA